MSRVMRNVVRTEYPGRRIVMHLECGHRSTRKQSQGAAERCACHDCEMLKRGAVITYPGLLRETWNAETQMPHRVALPPIKVSP